MFHGLFTEFTNDDSTLPSAVILKRFFCAKDLPRCLGLHCWPLGSSTNNSAFSPRSLLSAFKHEAFREILRPNEGLRMTILKTPKCNS